MRVQQIDASCWHRRKPLIPREVNGAGSGPRAALGAVGVLRLLLGQTGMEPPVLIRLAQEMAATGLQAVTDALPNEARFAAKAGDPS
jgi:hypothetical protein